MKIIDLVEGTRQVGLNYTEKVVKGKIDRVIAEFTGNQSGAITRLAGRYQRLNDAIEIMGKKRNELNTQIKGLAEELFNDEDTVLTRVLETVSFTLTISKRAPAPDKVKIDYDKIIEALSKLVPIELQPQIEAITEAYTTIIAQPEKSPALTVKPKVAESIGDWGAKILKIINALSTKIKAWAVAYDKKLNALKLKAQLK